MNLPLDARGKQMLLNDRVIHPDALDMLPWVYRFEDGLVVLRRYYDSSWVRRVPPERCVVVRPGLLKNAVHVVDYQQLRVRGLKDSARGFIRELDPDKTVALMDWQQEGSRHELELETPPSNTWAIHQLVPTCGYDIVWIRAAYGILMQCGDYFSMGRSEVCMRCNQPRWVHEFGPINPEVEEVEKIRERLVQFNDIR